MSSVWQFFTKKTALSYLLMIVLFVGGLYSAIAIQKESNPEIQIPIAIVSTVLPGASSVDVENLVTNEIEKGVQSLDNVKKITSTSRTGVSSVTIEFEASADIDDSIQDVKDAVDLVKPDLPDDATDPIVSDVNFADDPVLFVSVSSEAPKPLFKTLAEDLVDELERVPGVSNVNVSGIEDREVTVVLEPELLEQYQLSLQAVAQAIAAYNSSLPVGSIDVSGVEYAVTFEGDIDDPSEVEDIPIRTGQGSVVRLGDIATVGTGLADASSVARVSADGVPSMQAVSLTVFKQRGTDVIDVTTAVKARLLELEETLLEDATYAISFDSGEEIQRSLSELTNSGLQTIALVLVVLLIFLGWREAVIAALAIPMSFFIAFFALLVSGNTINFISLFSLILAIGILVDSAIVIVEAIHGNMKDDPQGDKVEAALKAIKDFHFPLTTGTLTTVAVFLPLFSISGITGEFIKTIPFTVIFALLASIVVALAFIPVIAATFLRRRSTSQLEVKQEQLSHRLQDWYQKKLRLIYGRNTREVWFVAVVVIAFFASLTFPAIGLVKVEFFPQGDIDFMYVEVELPQGSTIEATDLALRAVEEPLYDIEAIESFTARVGRGSSFNQSPGSGIRFASIDIDLKKDREVTSSEVVTELEKRYAAFADYKVTVSQPNNGPPTGAPIVITFSGDDLDQLNTTATEATKLLEAIEGTRNVRNSAQDDSAEFVLTIDRNKAAERGVSSSAVAGVLRASIFGIDATTIKTLDEDIDVVVTLNLNENRLGVHDTNQTSIDRILELTVQGAAGPVALADILTTSFEQAQEQIRHEDLERIATVSSELEPDVFATDITAQFAEKADAELTVPAGVTMSLGGENEEVDQSFRDMFVALIVGMLLMLAVLIVQFNSYKQALFTLSVVPLSLIGVMTGLALSQQSLSFPAMLGFIALSGIVVNNAIILIDVINGLRQKFPERPLDDLIMEGATSRLRPILLTSITTVAGVSPLIFVSELWRPIAYALIFGLTFAVVLTLIFIPVVYRRYHNRSALFALLCTLWRGITWPYRVVRRRF